MRKALWVDDVLRLLDWRISRSRLNKMPHCVVVGCNEQAKKNKDPKVRFHCFPEDPELYRAWVNAVKRTTLPKDPRVCSRHFERACFDESFLMELQLMGSSRKKISLKPDAIPTIFPHKSVKAARPSSVQRAEKRQRLEVSIYIYSP